MPNTGIEPATLRSLARRSNQLSYAAAKSCTVDVFLQHHVIYINIYQDANALALPLAAELHVMLSQMSRSHTSRLR